MKPNLIFVFTLTALLHRCWSFMQNATDGQQNNTNNNDNKNTYLTSNLTTYLFEKEYNAIDQCFQKEIGKKIGSFSLNFKFIGLFGDCTEGMLLCYPSTLEKSGAKYNYGMIVGTKYIVKNRPNNSVALACAEKWESACKSDHKKNKWSFCALGTVWHGIRVSRQIAGKICLELSIAKEKYEFKYVDQFNILFGNEHSLWTILTDGFGRQIEFHDDDKMRDAYLTKMAQNDAKLSNYVGFWMLGLDFLPMLSRRTAHLHVYRDCACEMHAWFHNPNENPHSSIANVGDKYPPMPKDCAIEGNHKEELKFSLGASAKIGNSILVKFRLADNAKSVIIGLKDQNGGLIFKMTITEETICLKTHKNKTGKRIDDFPRLANFWNNYLQIEFVVHPYLYEIKMNGTKVDNYMPWPIQWWQNEANKTERIEFLTLQNEIIYPKNANAWLSIKNQTLKPAISCVQLDEFVFGGYLIHFKGQIDQNAEFVDFYLLINALEINEMIGSAFLALEMNFTSNLLMAKYQIWNGITNSNEWFNYDDEAIKLDFLRPGDPFDLHIDLLNAVYGDDLKSTNIIVKLNTTKGDQNVSILTEEQFLKSHFVSTIRVDGNVTLFDRPDVKKKKHNNEQRSDDFLQYLLPINPLLSTDDAIEIEGILEKNAENLTIYLLHDTTNSDTEEPDYSLAIEFKFNTTFYEGIMIVKSVSINNKVCLEERNTICHQEVNSSRLFPGEEFEMRILVKPNYYLIYIHGSLALHFPSVDLPTWAGNILSIRGHLQNVTAQINRAQNGTLIMNLGEIGTTKRKMPIVAKLAYKNATLLFYAIHIKGTVKKAKNFTISLLHSSLEPSEIFGKLLLQMNFTNAEIAYQIFGKQSRKMSVQPQNQPEMPFNLNISFHANKEIKLKFNDGIIYTYDNKIPTWAIQYIRIDGEAIEVHGITEEIEQKEGENAKCEKIDLNKNNNC